VFHRNEDPVSVARQPEPVHAQCLGRDHPDADPGQTSPFRDTGLEVEMRELIRVEMASHEAPPELYTCFDLT
jgi:hypothetical protein